MRAWPKLSNLHAILFGMATLCGLFGLCDVTAQTSDPDPTGTETSRTPSFIHSLDALCGMGQQRATGCQAIRDREVLDATAPPWRAIGRVNFASTDLRQHCTGTLVAERVVLTAAHCLYNFARKSWIPAQSIRFAAGYQRGTAVAVSVVDRYVLHDSQTPDSRTLQRGVARDWALLILKDPLGRDIGFLPLHQANGVFAPDTTFALAGYPALRPHVLSLPRDCGAPAQRSQPDLMRQRCAVMSGDSGAPALAIINDTPKVIGILSGAISHPSEFFSVAIPLKSFSTALERARNAHGQ